jgi:uncharacterized membrane protein YhhN
VSAASWLVFAAFAVVCICNWVSRVRHLSTVELVTKPVATILAGVLCAVHGEHTGATTVALVAFALCLAGDVFLLDQVDRFVAGLAAFLLGHLAFVVACAIAGFDHPWWAVVAAAVVAVVVVTVGRRVHAGARRQDPALAIPVAAYLAVISVMTVAAWATGRPAALVGAGAFVLSDSILGSGKFVGERRWTAVAVMVTYHVALGGLALAL